MEMFYRILKKDLKRKKSINVILLMFVTLATMFLASSVNNLLAVGGAVDYFMEISKVPDYLVVGLSERDKDVIGNFLSESDTLSEYEIVDGFNVMNEQITILKSSGEQAKDYQRTNTMSIQAVPENYMKVFDSEDGDIHLENGEIAFSKIEAEENGLQIGDKVNIRVGEIEQEFEIAVIVKDAVFGSQMMGFKRIFITQEDFKKYEEQDGLIYTRLYCIDYEDQKGFEQEWNKEKFNIISSVHRDTVKMCYVMDMLVAAILIIVSICLILIAFLVLRFTIVFTLQEDYKEIGIMKAIGMRDMGIRSIYLIKYLAIAVLGAAVGLACSFPFGNMLLNQVIINIVVNKEDGNFIIHMLCAAAIVVVVLGFCYFCTGKLRKYTAMDAIRNGSNGERYNVKNRLKLYKRNRMSPCFYMALNDINSNFRRFIILGATFCMGIMLILLPLSAADTLKSDDIVNLFSISPSDVYINNGKTETYVGKDGMENLWADLESIEKELESHGIEAVTGVDLGYMIPCHAGDEEKTVNYFTLQEAGSWEREYTLLEGREPIAENEVIITDITAKEMDVSIGDSIYFKDKEGEKEYIITGTFQSMMNLGKGYRVSRDAQMDSESLSGVFCIQVDIPDMESEDAIEKLKEIFPDYKVMYSSELINSMIGGILDQIDVIMGIIVGIVLIINSLITVLMMKTIMAKERGEIALLKSVGFRNEAVKSWQVIRILIVLVTAIVIGTILSNVLAPFIIGPIFAMMGANKVNLVMNPLEAYVIYPLMLLIVTGISAYICAGDIRKVDLREVNDME